LWSNPEHDDKDVQPVTKRVRLTVLLLGLVFGALAPAQTVVRNPTPQPGVRSSQLQTVVTTGAAVVTEVNGVVQVRIGNDPPLRLQTGDRLPAGALVTTDHDAGAVLAFADGQVVVLGERTSFRIVNYDFDAKEMNRSGVFLNLIEGSLRLVMGLIGEFDPKLIRIQVGTGTLVGAANPEGGNAADAGVVVQGAATVVTVTQGRVSLTLPSGQGITLASGEGAYVQPNGAVRQGSVEQISTQLRLAPEGVQIMEQLDSMQTYVFPLRNQHTVITLATPGSVESTTTSASLPASPAVSTTTPTEPSSVTLPSEPTESVDSLDLPPLATTTTVTAATGAGGGGTPCGASCN
jgi:hypothetical protein